MRFVSEHCISEDVESGKSEKYRERKRGGEKGERERQRETERQRQRQRTSGMLLSS